MGYKITTCTPRLVDAIVSGTGTETTSTVLRWSARFTPQPPRGTTDDNHNENNNTVEWSGNFLFAEKSFLDSIPIADLSFSQLVGTFHTTPPTPTMTPSLQITPDM